MNIKKIKFKKIIYPIISIIFLVVATVFFVKAVVFLSGAVNAIFIADNESLESKLIKLDMEKFERVAERLGIDVNSQYPESGI